VTQNKAKIAYLLHFLSNSLLNSVVRISRKEDFIAFQWSGSSEGRYVGHMTELQNVIICLGQFEFDRPDSIAWLFSGFA
jgi:hypothetical protein